MLTGICSGLLYKGKCWYCDITNAQGVNTLYVYSYFSSMTVRFS